MHVHIPSVEVVGSDVSFALRETKKEKGTSHTQMVKKASTSENGCHTRLKCWNTVYW